MVEDAGARHFGLGGDIMHRGGCEAPSGKEQGGVIDNRLFLRVTLRHGQKVRFTGTKLTDWSVNKISDGQCVKGKRYITRSYKTDKYFYIRRCRGFLSEILMLSDDMADENLEVPNVFRRRRNKR